MSGAGVAAALRRRAPNVVSNSSSSVKSNTDQQVKPRPLTMQEVLMQTRNNVMALQQSYAQMTKRIQLLEEDKSNLYQQNVEKDSIIRVLENKVMALEQGHVNVGTNTLESTNDNVHNLSLDVADVKNMIIKLQNKIIDEDYSKILKKEDNNTFVNASIINKTPYNNVSVRDVMLVAKETECDIKTATSELANTNGDIIRSTINIKEQQNGASNITIDVNEINHDDNDDDDNEGDNDGDNDGEADENSSEIPNKSKKKRNKKHK